MVGSQGEPRWLFFRGTQTTYPVVAGRKNDNVPRDPNMTSGRVSGHHPTKQSKLPVLQASGQTGRSRKVKRPSREWTSALTLHQNALL